MLEVRQNIVQTLVCVHQCVLRRELPVYEKPLLRGGDAHVITEGH